VSGSLWDLLICSIPHRHERLVALLAELDRQMVQPWCGAILYRDNLETCYGDKVQTLVNASSADFVSCFDDDDWCVPDFVPRIAASLWALDPDYVGFQVKYTRDGDPQRLVEHSLRHDGWYDQNDGLFRDITHFNPIRREIALGGQWEGGNGADRRWADRVRNKGTLKEDREHMIYEELYHYRENTSDTFNTTRGPYLGQLPELPSYPWLTVIGS
jgi:hypothetical protein